MMLDKNVLAEISEILTPKQLKETKEVHIEIHNGFAYGKVILTSSNTDLLIELKQDLLDVSPAILIDAIEIPCKSGRGALLIASKISEDLTAKGIAVTQSEKAFR